MSFSSSALATLPASETGRLRALFGISEAILLGQTIETFTGDSTRHKSYCSASQNPRAAFLLATYAATPDVECSDVLDAVQTKCPLPC